MSMATRTDTQSPALHVADGHDLIPEHARALLEAARGDVNVLEQVERDEPVVPRRLGVVDDLPQLLQMRRPQVVGDVVHRLRGQQAQCLRVHLEERPAVRLERRDPLGGDQSVGVSS
jgi:hypothetical protein